MRKLAARGAFEKKRRGVYRDPYFPPVNEFDYLREALLTLGDGAYNTAETVLEVLGIGEPNPRFVHFASNKRHTRKLPESWRIARAKSDEKITKYHGLAAQHVAGALHEVFPSVMPDRWRTMVDEARNAGFLSSQQYDELKNYSSNPFTI